MNDKEQVNVVKENIEKSSILNKILVDIHKNKDEKIPTIQVDKNKIIEKQHKQLIEQIFSIMVTKGLINNGFNSHLDLIEKLQLIRKFSK